MRPVARDGFEFAIKSKGEVHGTQDVPLRSAPPRGTDPLRPRWSQREDSQEDSRPGFMGMLFSCALCSQQPPQVTQRRAHACSRDRRAPSRMLPFPSGRPVLVLGSRGRLGAVVLKAEERLGKDLGIHALGDGDLGTVGTNEQLQALCEVVGAQGLIV